MTVALDADLPEPEKKEEQAQRANLRLRVLSSLILAPLAIVAAYLGGVAFALFWALAGLGVLWEWSGLAAPREREPTIVAGAASLIATVALALLGAPHLALAALALGAIAVGLLASAGQRGWQALGVFYAGGIALAPLVLRGADADGFHAILFIFAVVWATDIFAYFIGRALGGPRLWPAVSPKKTWSGAIGGTLAAVAAGIVTAALLGERVAAAWLAVCLVLSIGSQAGDLAESAIKRHFGVKDSSGLIPGHGGLMDRLDGFVVAVVMASMIGLARGGLETPARGLLVW